MKRTTIYIDGFNLYYGCLKKTAFKWLDLKSLFVNILDSGHHITQIKYFTAMLSDRKNNQHSLIHQQAYLRAVQNYIPELEIHFGHYLTHAINLPLANSTPNKPKFVKVLKSEEKGSDVNLSLHVLNDAWLNRYDCAVIVSNDSDLAESMRLVKKHHHKLVGLIPPGYPEKRRLSKQLFKHADFMKRIRPGVLRASQLPELIPSTELRKPDAWY